MLSLMLILAYSRIIFINTDMNRATEFPTLFHVRPAKTQISLHIRTGWLESSLSVRRLFGSLATHSMASEDADQSAQLC